MDCKNLPQLGCDIHFFRRLDKPVTSVSVAPESVTGFVVGGHGRGRSLTPRRPTNAVPKLLIDRMKSTRRRPYAARVSCLCSACGANGKQNGSNCQNSRSHFRLH
jgi:hypothetical protein